MITQYSLIDSHILEQTVTLGKLIYKVKLPTKRILHSSTLCTLSKDQHCTYTLEEKKILQKIIKIKLRIPFVHSTDLNRTTSVDDNLHR